MGRPKTIISKSQLAKELGVSKSRISQFWKRPDFPRRPDGRVDRDAAVNWYRNARIEAGYEAKPIARKKSAAVSAEERQETGRLARVRVLREIAAPAVILQFARVLLRAGATPLLAFIGADWFASAPSLALPDIESSDVESGFDEPTRAQWQEVLGPDFDFDAAESAADEAIWPEIDPDRKRER